MPRFNGSLALALDFGGTTTTATPGTAGVCGACAPLRLAHRSFLPDGPDKYKVLDCRRRSAQLRARHLLDLLDAPELITR